MSTGPRVPVQQLVVGAVAGQHGRVFRPVEVTHRRAVALALGLEGVTPARPAPHQEYIQRGVPRAHRQARVIWRVLDVLDGRTLGHDRAKYRAQRLFVKHGEFPVLSPDGDVMRPLVVPGGLRQRLVAARHRTRREPDVGASEHLGLGRAPQVQAAALRRADEHVRRGRMPANGAKVRPVALHHHLGPLVFHVALPHVALVRARDDDVGAGIAVDGAYGDGRQRPGLFLASLAVVYLVLFLVVVRGLHPGRVLGERNWVGDLVADGVLPGVPLSNAPVRAAREQSEAIVPEPQRPDAAAPRDRPIRLDRPLPATVRLNPLHRLAAAPQQQGPVGHARDHRALRHRHIPRGRFAQLGRFQELARQHVSDAEFPERHRDCGPPLRRRVHGPLLQVLLAPGAESLQAGLRERVPLDAENPHWSLLEPRALADQADDLTPRPGLADARLAPVPNLHRVVVIARDGHQLGTVRAEAHRGDRPEVCLQGHSCHLFARPNVPNRDERSLLVLRVRVLDGLLLARRREGQRGIRHAANLNLGGARRHARDVLRVAGEEPLGIARAVVHDAQGGCVVRDDVAKLWLGRGRLAAGGWPSRAVDEEEVLRVARHPVVAVHKLQLKLSLGRKRGSVRERDVKVARRVDPLATAGVYDLPLEIVVNHRVPPAHGFLRALPRGAPHHPLDEVLVRHRLALGAATVEPAHRPRLLCG